MTRKKEKPESAKPGIDWEKLGPAIPGFSCLAMKDAGQARVLAETAGMSREEELAYWRKHERALRRRIARQRKKNQG